MPDPAEPRAPRPALHDASVPHVAHDYARMADAFVSGEFAPAHFSHRDHVGVAVELLQQQDFLTACVSYVKGIRALADRLGARDKFNLTVTIAFLAIISERLRQMPKDPAGRCSPEALLATNPDLASPGILQTWYSPGRLASGAGRAAFLMPDRHQPA